MTRDELDTILNEGLASYSMEEPRPGLPGRVMARVRVDGAKGRRRWYLLAAAAAAFASLVVVMVLHREAMPEPPAAWAPPPVAVMIEPPPMPRHPQTPRPAFVAPHPRREIFPEASPMTSNERTLIALAQKAPEAARWLAEQDKPLAIDPIEIQPLDTGGTPTGEQK
jgi:hypothetical protein